MYRKSKTSTGSLISAVLRVLPMTVPAVVLVVAFSTPGNAKGSGYDWPQFNFDAAHSGNNTVETQVGRDNITGLKRLFRIELPAIVDGAPAYLHQVEIGGATIDMVFVTSKEGHIIALDATSGKQIWSKQYGAGPCRINNGYEPCYTTSSPVLDPGRQFVYSYGLDGYVHKFAVSDGTEVTSGGWPELCTLKPFNEKGSSALSVATSRDGNSYLYATNGGYLGDRGDYQGHVTAINLSDGTQSVFNANCSNESVHFEEEPSQPDCPAVQSAIWARAGAVYVASLDAVFVATGNGPFDPSKFDWGDSVLRLHADGTGEHGGPVDSYTPEDYQYLQDRDLDLGSTAPAVLPTLSKSSVRHLAVQGGKDQKLRLINLDNMSGRGGPGHVGGQVGQIIDVPQGGMVFTAPAVWVNPADSSTRVFLATNRGICGLKLTTDTQGTPLLQLVWQTGKGGSSPIIANGVLYYAGDAGIMALDPVNGNELWRDNSIGPIHWQSPIVANGRLYITDQNSQLSAYSLGGSAR